MLKKKIKKLNPPIKFQEFSNTNKKQSTDICFEIIYIYQHFIKHLIILVKSYSRSQRVKQSILTIIRKNNFKNMELLYYNETRKYLFFL